MSWQSLLAYKIARAQELDPDLIVESYKPGEKRLYCATRRPTGQNKKVRMLSEYVTFREFWGWLDGYIAAKGG